MRFDCPVCFRSEERSFQGVLTNGLAAACPTCGTMMTTAQAAESQIEPPPLGDVSEPTSEPASGPIGESVPESVSEAPAVPSEVPVEPASNAGLAAVAGAAKVGRGRAIGLRVAMLSTLLLAVAASVVGYRRYWDTPDRALWALVEHAGKGDVQGARPFVDPAVWPPDVPTVPPELTRALTRFVAKQGIGWSERSDDSASIRWTYDSPAAEFRREGLLRLQRGPEGWRVLEFGAGWNGRAQEAAETISDVRKQLEAKDAEGLMKRLVPGDATCKQRECRKLGDAIAAGKPHRILETLAMKEIVPGSLKVIEKDDELTVRWLRPTTYLGQQGIVELRLRREEGEWKIVATDDSHFDAMNDEMETWVENHGEMLWRDKLSSLVEVTSLPSYCGNWFFGRCILQILPTNAKNTGTQTIRAMKFSKVRAAKYVGNASQTLWGIFKNIAPGQSTHDIVSGNTVRSRSPLNLSETWEFYRVNWIEFGDGTRLDYSPKDYRFADGATLTFEDVRAARERGGRSSKKAMELNRKLKEAGYSPPSAQKRSPVDAISNNL